MSDGYRLTDKWEDEDATSLHVWMQSKNQEHHKRVSPYPVVYECRTCDGTGTGTEDSASAVGIPGGQFPIGPCPDCTQGWVANIGTIEQHCTEHNSPKVQTTHCYVAHYQCSDEQRTHRPCVFGLVLVVPIGDGE